MFFPYTLIKFDIEKEEPVRNSKGLCVEAARGELVSQVEGYTNCAASAF